MLGLKVINPGPLTAGVGVGTGVGVGVGGGVGVGKTIFSQAPQPKEIKPASLEVILTMLLDVP